MTDDAQAQDHPQADLCAEITDYIREHDISQSSLARRLEIPAGTLSQLLTGTYPGKTDGRYDTLRKWLEDQRASDRAKEEAADAPDFIRTPTARAITEILSFAQNRRKIAVLTSAPGCGKTMASLDYAQGHSQVFLITLNATVRTPHSLMQALIRNLGIRPERRPGGFDDVRAFFERHPGALLILDESQHLTFSALDVVRTVHDQVNTMGVVFSGNTSLVLRLAGDNTTPEFGQLKSRINLRLNLDSPKYKQAREGDIGAMLRHWKITDAEQKQFLTGLARQAGHLRTLNNVMDIANVIMPQGKRKMTIEILREAYHMHTGEQPARRRIDDE